jgi:flagellar biosynthetic protein FlhB
MADESDLEKTEQPTPRRLEQGREEGQVPQSRELSTFFVLITGASALWAMGGWIGGRLSNTLTYGFSFERAAAFDTQRMLETFGTIFLEVLVTMLPLFGLLMLAAVAAPISLGGFVFSSKVLAIKPERMNPLKGLKRMFSVHGLAELVKSVLKALVIGSIGAFAVWRERENVFSLMGQPLEYAVPQFFQTLALAALLIILGLALIALMDVPFQLWQFHRRMRMTREEVKRENKEQEGDPHVKARVRSIQREMARRRMMAEVPKADVVVTNPTHFSVALKYDGSRMGAPVVVAKGHGEVALKIREIAAEHDVPLLEAPPLARALHAHCEIGDAIPAALYTAVAEVMAYVYQLNAWLADGGKKPPPPKSVAVPDGLDPGARQ